MQSNFVHAFRLIQVFGCLRGTLVVTKVLGGLFVSSESGSYTLTGPVESSRT